MATEINTADVVADRPPSYFASQGSPCCSRWGKSEIEWLALAYVQALAADGDVWKRLSRERVMSYTLIEERAVKAARKVHQCIWCGQAIEVGAPYTYERSVFEGDPQSHHWHPECLKAMRDVIRAEGGGELTFDAYNEQRPDLQHGSGKP